MNSSTVAIEDRAPAMKIAQLTALLDALPTPALVCNESGAVIARNRAALDADWASPDWGNPLVEAQDLGDGWRLAQRKTPSDVVATMAATTYPADIDTLAQGIVHEIRNPLAAILTGARLVQDDPQVAEETAMLLGVIRKESLRINDILTAFSNYVKPPPPHPAPFDLAQVARDTVEELRREEVLSPAIIVEDVLEPPLMVWADEAHFRSALFQILRNAADAMQYDEAVRLSSQTQDHKVIFFVDDNGPGFSAESLQRAFQPFYSTKPQSIGLGLSLAQATVQASGGRVWIENLSSSPLSVSSDEAQNQPSRNGVPLSLRGARACIELPIAPIQT